MCVDNLKLAAVGDNCMDVYDATAKVYPGGNPVNVAVYTQRMGGAASYIGVVGDDANGELMCNAIAAKGVDVSHLHTRAGATAVTHVTIVDGERILGEYEEGVMADFCLTQEDMDFLCTHDLVFSALWGMVEDRFEELKRRGMCTAFDFADKVDHPVIEKALPWVDYAFFSRGAASDEEIREFLKTVTDKGVRIAVVTRGEKGSMAYDGNTYYSCGIVPCAIKDTMGAGDSYIAGFLYGIMRGYTVPECMEMGAHSSALTLSYCGSW